MWHVWEAEEGNTVFLWGELRKRHHLEDVGVDGTKILKKIFTRSGRMWDGLVVSFSGWGQVAGVCECGNASLGSIKYGKFLD
jgi:hypothetical protein